MKQYSMAEIESEQKKVFDEMFTVNDILKGDNIEMHKDARKVALKRLHDRDKKLIIYSSLKDDVCEHVFLEFVNDFITIARMASYYDVDEKALKAIINRGREVNNGH